MTAFLIAQIRIHDREEYGQYEAGFMAVFADYGGSLRAVDEAPDVIEGDWPFTRTVLIEFPSKEAARAWYDSDAYQALARHRFRAAEGNAVLINGL